MYLFFIDCCFSVASCLCDAVVLLLNGSTYNSEQYITVVFQRSKLFETEVVEKSKKSNIKHFIE